MAEKLIRKLLILCIVTAVLIGGCGKRQDAYNNEKMSQNITEEATQEQSTQSDQEKEEDQNTDTDIDAEVDADTDADVVSSDDTDEAANPNAIQKENSTYDCDIEADKAAYDGHVDITVGDNYYATQINDWYMYFNQYEGKVVEIEGYYIGEFQPYDFVGRYGPTCPYCQGGYVSFEILTDEDLTQYQSAEDWIKVTGILRKGIDADYGDFYYIEVLELEKMDEVGQDTVTN